jgi:hypothetical protein
MVLKNSGLRGPYVLKTVTQLAVSARRDRSRHRGDLGAEYLTSPYGSSEGGASLPAPRSLTIRCRSAGPARAQGRRLRNGGDH